MKIAFRKANNKLAGARAPNNNNHRARDTPRYIAVRADKFARPSHTRLSARCAYLHAACVRVYIFVFAWVVVAAAVYCAGMCVVLIILYIYLIGQKRYGCARARELVVDLLRVYSIYSCIIYINCEFCCTRARWYMSERHHCALHIYFKIWQVGISLVMAYQDISLYKSQPLKYFFFICTSD